MPTNTLKKYLDENNIKYVSIKHSPAYTASEIAQSAHVPGKIVAKSVIIKKNDGQMAMVVLTANDKINFDQLERAIGEGRLELASEREFQDKFPGCEVGAMPPFGNLYDMEVYVDEHLSRDNEIIFNAGSHSELVRMKFSDYKNLTHPKIIHTAA